MSKRETEKERKRNRGKKERGCLSFAHWCYPTTAVTLFPIHPKPNNRAAKPKYPCAAAKKAAEKAAKYGAGESGESGESGAAGGDLCKPKKVKVRGRGFGQSPFLQFSACVKRVRAGGMARTDGLWRTREVGRNGKSERELEASERATRSLFRMRAVASKNNSLFPPPLSFPLTLSLSTPRDIITIKTTEVPPAEGEEVRGRQVSAKKREEERALVFEETERESCISSSSFSPLFLIP